MKIRNPAPLRPERQLRGISSGLRAGIRGVTVRDSITDVHPVLDIKFQGAVVTELDDDTALVTIGGSGSGGAPGTGGDPGEPSGVLFAMLNNSGQDLLPGDVVVVDETADRAVTVTTTEGDTRIVGVVQEPIADGLTGLVLFNGYTPVINASGVTRGEYAKTSTSAAIATSSADREAGSFAVYLTGDDIAEEFAVDSVTTTSEVTVASLSIDMPAIIPVDRVLFLALWLEDGTSSVSVAGGWTLIGSESGFYYYYRVSTEDNTATASWTTASTVVATVLLLHESVFLPNPVESHDYDDTTSAATVGSLSDAPRYAIAGVQADVASPGSGFVRLGGGTSSFEAGPTVDLVQWKAGRADSAGVTMDANATVGNMLVGLTWVDCAGVTMYGLNDPRDPGSSPEVTSPWAAQAHFYGATSARATGSIHTKIADETYPGPWASSANSTADAARSRAAMLEFSGVSEVAAVLHATDDQQGSDIDCGTFTGYGADDVIVMSVVFKKDGTAGVPGIDFASFGFTELIATGDRFSNGGSWLGYKIGGTADAKITHSGGSTWNWGAAAIHLTAGAQGAAGTLAGKYIGHDSSATSPFSGAGNATDAIFAINLLQDAKPSALLYGPDLGGSGDGSEPTADAHIADTTDAHDASAISVADAGGYFTGTDVEAALQELGADIGDSIIRVTADVSPAQSVPLPPWVKPSGSGVITADPQGRVTIDSGSAYKAFPGMTYLEGRLHLVYRSGTNHNSGDGVIKYRTSDDLGRTWSAASTIYTPGAGDDYRDPCITALSSGRLLLSLHRATTGGTVAVEVLTGYSDNRGITWASLTAVPTSFTGQVAASSPPLELPSGTILQAGYGQNSGATRYTSVVWSSTDGGLTFGDQTTVAVDGTLSFTELTIRYLASGKLVALVREETTGDTYRVTSTDLGATWSAEVSVIDNNVAGRPDFVEFFPGALLWFGRGTSNASRWAVSWDEGATWTALQETDSGETLDSQYHAPVVLAPGYVVVVYCIENSSTDSDVFLRYYFDGYGTDPLGQARLAGLTVDGIELDLSDPDDGEVLTYDSGSGTIVLATAAGTVTAADLVALGVVGPILIADDHSTPIVFGDILLTEDGDDILYADLGG